MDPQNLSPISWMQTHSSGMPASELLRRVAQFLRPPPLRPVAGRDRMDSRALFPNRSGSSSATLSAASCSSRLSSPRRTPGCKARCLPAFPPPLHSRATPDALRDNSSSTNPNPGRDSSFSALPDLSPDRPLLRPRPRSRSPPVFSPVQPCL